MKKKEKNQLRTQDVSELKKLIQEAREKMAKHEAGRGYKSMRKRLAILQTFLREKEMTHG